MQIGEEEKDLKEKIFLKQSLGANYLSKINYENNVYK
jgi:hypothetical protein